MGIQLALGPYPLTRENVSAVAKARPGAYMLTRGRTASAWPVQYVGRSDSSLLNRLMSHADDGVYAEFRCSHASSDTEAFQLECQMYHDYGGDRGILDNEIHPDRPNGLAALLYSKCPGCSKFD